MSLGSKLLTNKKSESDKQTDDQINIFTKTTNIKNEDKRTENRIESLQESK